MKKKEARDKDCTYFAAGVLCLREPNFMSAKVSAKGSNKDGGQKKAKVEALSFDGLEVIPVIDPSSIYRANNKQLKKEQKEKKKRKLSEIEVKKSKYDREQKGEDVVETEGSGKAYLKGAKSMGLRKKLQKNEERTNYAIDSAARAEVLLPSEQGYMTATGMNKTYRFAQTDLKDVVDESSKRKMFNLKLDKFGPYCMDYTKNGKFLLLGGRKGHLSLLDWKTFALKCEIHVKETVRDVKFLHSEDMFAVAQKKYVYIYDSSGLELHCLRNHIEPTKLEFLPYHFLLASVGKTGYLKYQDTSTGQVVVEHRTRLGECNVMTQNRNNAVLCLGHNNGSVTMWSPNVTTPLVKIAAHRAPLLAAAVDVEGIYLTTSGLDGQIKVWDIRTYKEVHSYFTVRPASTIDISHTGQLALGYGPHVQVWKDALRTKQQAPYMVEELPSLSTTTVRFCPYEDILGVSHSEGFNSMVVPGAGEANFDTFEANPFQTRKQQRENTVHALLEKLSPDMISLEPSAFGMMDEKSKVLYSGERKVARDIRETVQVDTEKDRARGKNKASKRARRKRKNIVDAQTKAYRESMKKQEEDQLKRKEDAKNGTEGTLIKSALDRFKS